MRLLRFAVAPLSVAAVTAVKLLLPAIEPTHSFLLYFFAVAASAWAAGPLGGFAATALIAIAVPLLARRAGVGEDVMTRVVIFCVEGSAITLLIDMLRRQRAAANEANVALHESRAILGNIIETVPSAIVATNPDGTIFLFNRATELLTGYRREEVIGKSLIDFFVPDDWRDEVAERFRDPFSPAVREPHRNPWRTKSGQQRLIEWRCAALPAENGIRILGVGVDVTDLRKAEEERANLMVAEQEARLRAEEANRAKDRFLATISHELRAPLTAMLGWAELLLLDSQLDDTVRTQGLTAIADNARAQAQLIEQLIDFARISSGKIALDPKPVPVDNVVRSVVDGFIPAAQQKRLEVRSFVDGGSLVVRADETRLRQILTNVIQNAIRYTDHGYVDVRAERIDGHVVVSIADSGRGIAPEFLPHVFERFAQETRQDAGAEGLGLGLAIVKELVTLHGGSIQAESDGPGKGSRFLVKLPAA